MFGVGFIKIEYEILQMIMIIENIWYEKLQFVFIFKKERYDKN